MIVDEEGPKMGGFKKLRGICDDVKMEWIRKWK